MVSSSEERERLLRERRIQVVGVGDEALWASLPVSSASLVE